MNQRYRDTPVMFMMLTFSALGRLGTKSMNEAPCNSVAPGLANAIRNATGTQLYELPMWRDLVRRARGL